MHRLLEEKLPIAEVARRVGRSRQTIYNWLRQEEDEPVPAPRPSKLDPHRGYIESRLERYDLPATVLLEEIQAQGYTGGITILRDLVATIKQRHIRRVVDRFETEPGRQAQMDWASCGTIWHQGRRRRLSLFTLVLGYSRVIWARFVISEKRPVLMELLEEAFSELGGVPRELLVDNLKQVIAIVRSAETSAVVQTEFADFAEHWGFEVVACPPYWPRAKGKVERAIQYIKTSFLEGRSFTDLEDLNAQLRVWLAETANVRLHGTTRMRPVDRLAFDLEGMRSLEGLSGYPRALAGVRQADHDGWISYGGVRYSTDPHILGARRGVEVAVEISTRGELIIRHQGRLVGRHRLQPSGSPPQDDPAHAAARRQLRQRPPESPPRPRAPRFEQQLPEQIEALLALAPHVEARALAAYEGVR